MFFYRSFTSCNWGFLFFKVSCRLTSQVRISWTVCVTRLFCLKSSFRIQHYRKFYYYFASKVLPAANPIQLFKTKQKKSWIKREFGTHTFSNIQIGTVIPALTLFHLKKYKRDLLGRARTKFGNAGIVRLRTDVRIGRFNPPVYVWRIGTFRGCRASDLRDSFEISSWFTFSFPYHNADRIG